ncbi:MAG: BamA/TamA family outer membrane protein, partial [Leptotrichia sp.]|nr:BamA/TamA family outer membrane protein [Leptotrichia sp.]
KENLKVGTIQFSQLKEIPEEFLREKIPVKEGDVYSNKSLSEIYLALKRLNYISNVNVYPQQEGDTVNLVVEVDETANALEAAQRAETAQDLTKKTEFVVSKVDVKGLEKISKEEALKNVKVKEGDQFIPQEAIDGAQKIFQTGLFASVEPSVEREANNTVAITYIVEENPIVKDIEISGNTLFTEAQLEQALGIKEGELLNGNLLNPDNNGIIKLYNKGGYTTARIETINVSKEGDIKIGLTEGMVDSVVFKKVNSKRENERSTEYKAKLRTKPYIFERSQSVKPGEILESKNVEATIRDLYRTGIFTSIEPVVSGSETDPNARTVEFLVEERPTTTINGSISYGTSVGLVGGLKLADSNFLGRGQEASINLEASNKGDKTFDISWFDPWLKNTERVQAGGSIYWRESVDDNAGPLDVEKVRKIGTRWTIGKGLNDKIYVRLSARYDHYKEILGSKQINDTYNLIALTPSLIYDSRDNSYAPTKGIYSTLTYEKGDLIKDKRKYDQFEADLRAYHHTFFKDKNVMAYRVVWGSTGSGTPDALRFSIGGAETLRGYEYGKFEGFNKFHATVENRTQINKTLQFVTFFDIGNAWQKSTVVGGRKINTPDRHNASNFADLKKGVGVGIRLNTPIGPLRFDYGWPLDPEEKGGQKTGGKFYFSFGQTF